ncbi:hypothetical protein RFI_23117, partial [Reticulomyxa filosa]
EEEKTLTKKDMQFKQKFNRNNSPYHRPQQSNQTIIKKPSKNEDEIDMFAVATAHLQMEELQHPYFTDAAITPSNNNESRHIADLIPLPPTDTYSIDEERDAHDSKSNHNKSQSGNHLLRRHYHFVTPTDDIRETKLDPNRTSLQSPSIELFIRKDEVVTPKKDHDNLNINVNGNATRNHQLHNHLARIDVEKSGKETAIGLPLSSFAKDDTRTAAREKTQKDLFVKENKTDSKEAEKDKTKEYEAKDSHSSHSNPNKPRKSLESLC